jgi:hypothetical protein
MALIGTVNGNRHRQATIHIRAWQRDARMAARRTRAATGVSILAPAKCTFPYRIAAHSARPMLNSQAVGCFLRSSVDAFIYLLWE